MATSCTQITEESINQCIITLQNVWNEPTSMQKRKMNPDDNSPDLSFVSGQKICNDQFTYWIVNDRPPDFNAYKYYPGDGNSDNPLTAFTPSRWDDIRNPNDASEVFPKFVEDNCVFGLNLQTATTAVRFNGPSCNGFGPDICPGATELGTENIKPLEWPVTIGVSEANNTKIQSGFLASCSYQYDQNMTARQISALYNDSKSAFITVSKQDVGRVIDFDNFNKNLMARWCGTAVKNGNNNGQQFVCPVDPETGMGSAACSRMKVSGPQGSEGSRTGAICQEWVGDMTNGIVTGRFNGTEEEIYTNPTLVDTAMNTYCQDRNNEMNIDCACIQRELFEPYKTITDNPDNAILTGNPGCWWKPCQGGNAGSPSLIPPSADFKCTANICQQIFDIKNNQADVINVNVDASINCNNNPTDDKPNFQTVWEQYGVWIIIVAAILIAIVVIGIVLWIVL